MKAVPGHREPTARLPSRSPNPSLNALFVAALCLVGFGNLTTGADLAHPLAGGLALALITGAIGVNTGVLGLEFTPSSPGQQLAPGG